ncbi:fibrohexamerin-like [Pieris rapae]|uniref:fibrohexamerin-like n=1 Tax=Pieris rapae TaxID=64459 RepID=UPI001E280E1C|nr:fibrohexamerin-like [Pieris rapae]
MTQTLQETNTDSSLTISDLKNITDIQNVIEKLNEIVKNQNDSDEDDYIERPCRVFDPECIRSYFAAHGHCKKVDGTVPEPLHRSASTGYLPRINLTVTLVNVDYYGLNGQIVEFYINRKTNKLVLAVQMSNVVSFVRPAYFRFHRRAQEPIVRSTPARVQFGTITPTIIIPNLNDLRLDQAEIFSYIESPSPITTVNPLAFASTD